MNISVSGLNKKYKDCTALQDISFDVSSGDVLGILGANGAGKTTLLRIITGIINPSSGNITLDGTQLSNELILNNIGYLPEERGLYKKMAAIDCVLFLASLKNISKKDATAFVNQKIVDLEIDFDLSKPVGSFSKGMQQKVQLLAATVHHPKILILDEPFSGLDPMNSQVIKKEIVSLAENGTTILMSTHRMDTFEDLCKSFLFLRKGQILAKGPKKSIMHDTNVLKIQLTTEFEFSETELLEKKQIVNGYEYVINPTGTVNQIVQRLLDKSTEIIAINPHVETLEDVFIQMNRNFNDE